MTKRQQSEQLSWASGHGFPLRVAGKFQVNSQKSRVGKELGNHLIPPLDFKG